MLFLPHRSRSLLAALLLSGSTALQATVTTPDNGDIFVGFRASAGQGSGVSLLVNLADDSTLRGATAGSLLSLANLSASLTEVFGADWSTRSDLSWGVFGARNQVNAVTYGSRTQTPVGQPAAPFGVQDLSQRTATKNQIVSVIEAYRLLDAFQANTNAALQTNNLNSGSYSFQVGSVGTSDFGSLSQWVSIEGDFSLGANASVLDFFRFSETGTERLGSFEISSAGAISFTRAQAAGVAGIRLAEPLYGKKAQQIALRHAHDLSTTWRRIMTRPS